ncbi:NAD(P)H-hydrate dehydratase [Ramlibacter sp. MMS24-I3-19]|uniref:NAD(P)H-hydrate dehydratase n=1 Tax=Ramlibacter sp. MMS24-I3-19 TaxID=3416606 RepID=UPI003D07CBF2
MSATPARLDGEALLRWPLPALDDGADKEARGRVLVIGGSREVAGAVLLAGTAALRVGAGKLVLATVASAAASLAMAMPEARVIALPETPGGGVDPDRVSSLEPVAEAAGAVLVGPGMMDAPATEELVARLMPSLRGRTVVLDARAMDVVTRLQRFDEPVLLTPHAGEMAHLSGAAKEDVLAEPLRAAREAARRWNAVVALKGAQTVIARPDGDAWLHEGGNAGLATSGSGDTLAGAIAGLAARGASLEQACAWGVVLHARAGEQLAERLGPVGYLARELPLEMLAVLRGLEAQAHSTR